MSQMLVAFVYHISNAHVSSHASRMTGQWITNAPLPLVDCLKSESIMGLIDDAYRLLKDWWSTNNHSLYKDIPS